MLGNHDEYLLLYKTNASLCRYREPDVINITFNMDNRDSPVCPQLNLYYLDIQ